MEEVTRPLQQTDGEIATQNVLAILIRRKRLFLQVAGGIFLAFIIFGAMQPAVFEASAWMLLSPPEMPSKDAMLAQASLFSSTKSEMAIHIKLLHRVEMIQQVISELDADMEPRKFLKAATISEVAHSSGNLLAISFEHTDPEFAAKVVNRWAELYEEDSRKRSTTSTMAAIAYVEEQLENVEADLHDAGERSAAIEQQNLETAIAGGSIVSAEQYSALLAELGAVRAEEAAVQAQLARMQKLAKDEPEELEEIERQPSIKAEAIEEQLAELNIELQHMLKDYYDDSPEIEGMREHIARLEKQLDSGPDLTRTTVTSAPNPSKVSARDAVMQLSGQLDGIRARKNVISQQVERQREFADLAPTLGVEYAALKRKALGLEQVHAELLSQLYQLRLQAAMAVPPIRLVQAAEIPDTPVAPHLVSIIGIGLTLGLIIALIVSITVDYVDDTFATVEEIPGMLRFRLIGAIPEDKSSQTPVSPDARSLHANAIRTLASTLRMQMQRKGISSLSITSAGNSEGRSTMAANIAVMLARAGMDVILVDGDTQEPVQHRIFNIDNSGGLISLLANQSSLDNVAIRVGEPHLRVIPSGHVSDALIMPIGDPQAVEAIETINQAAEVVIWDTPPAAVHPDATLITSQAQASLFVIDRKTKRKAAARTLKALRNSGVYILGVIANRFQMTLGPYQHNSNASMAEEKTAKQPFQK